MKRLACFVASLVIVMAAGCQRQESSAPIPTGGGPSPMVFQNEINTLNSILAKDPKNLNALIKLGNIHMDTNNFPKAIEAYERALAIDPKNQNVRVDMGACYRSVGRSDRALALFEEATTMDPNHAIGHMNAGIVLLYDFNKPEEALVRFERFLELAPTHPNANGIRTMVQEIRTKGSSR